MSWRCGYCALVGRPNVGKSTLVNALVGQKVSITSRRPQTTRRNILGIANWQQTQAIFIDTPGLNQQRPDARSRAYNSAALEAIADADLLLLLLDRQRFTELDEDIYARLAGCKQPIVLLFNKVDRLADRAVSAEIISQRQQQARQAGFTISAIEQLSARSGYRLEALRALISQLLPASPQALFPLDMRTDQSQLAQVEELVREQIMRQMGDELPYEVQVRISPWNAEAEGVITIAGRISCVRSSQKAMLIGSRGSRIKSIGTKARAQIEKLLGRQVMLNLQVVC